MTYKRLKIDILSNGCLFKAGTIMSIQNWNTILRLPKYYNFMDMFDEVTIQDIIQTNHNDRRSTFLQLVDFHSTHINPKPFIHLSQLKNSLVAIFNISMKDAAVWVDYFIDNGYLDIDDIYNLKHE